MLVRSRSEDALWSSREIIQTQPHAETPGLFHSWHSKPSDVSWAWSSSPDEPAGSMAAFRSWESSLGPGAPDVESALIVPVGQVLHQDLEPGGSVLYRLPIACKEQPGATTSVATGLLPATQPPWITRAAARFEAVLELPEGWDGRGAKRPGLWPALEAFGFLKRVMRDSTALPSIVPLTDGGIQIEWHRGDLDIEATFTAGRDRGLYFGDLSIGYEFEGPIDEGIEELRLLIGRLEKANAATSVHAA